MDQVITSRQNTIVKFIRGLRDKRSRDREKRFVIEGVKMLSEAFDSGIYPEQVIVSEGAQSQPAVKELLARLGQGPQVIRTSDGVMEYMCETETPQGILALVPMREILLTGLDINPSSIIVVMDGVQDPGNVGTIIRAADAFDAHAVLLTGYCADLYNAKTLRSTMGSLFHIPVIAGIDVNGLVDFFRLSGVAMAVTCLEKTSVDIDQAVLDRPLALVFGSEARGVSPELAHAANQKIKIPMAGMAESLNVAVAAGIVLYEVFRRHGSKAKSNL